MPHDGPVARLSSRSQCFFFANQVSIPGSYGGFLSALARIRYPETFYGSIAMSPALTNFGASTTIQENPYRFAASDWVANVYWDTNPYAAQKIRDALKELDSCAKGKTDSPEIVH